MKRVLHLSRWATVLLTVAGVIGLVMLTYPGGVLAAYQDVRDSRDLTQEIRDAQRFNDELSDRSVIVTDRIAMKDAVVRNLIDGHLSLGEAATRFIEWFADDRASFELLQRRFGDRPIEELAVRNVIEYVAAVRTPHATAIHDRLTREYEARFGRRYAPTPP